MTGLGAVVASAAEVSNSGSEGRLMVLSWVDDLSCSGYSAVVGVSLQGLP